MPDNPFLTALTGAPKQDTVQKQEIPTGEFNAKDYLKKIREGKIPAIEVGKPLNTPQQAQEVNNSTNWLEDLGAGFESGSRQLIGGSAYMLGALGSKDLKQWGSEVIDNSPKGEGFMYQAGTILPQVVGSLAAVGASPFTAGTSLSAIPAIIGGINITNLATSVVGSSLKEYDDYHKEKGIEPDQLSRWGVGLANGALEFVAEKFRLSQFLPKGVTGKFTREILEKTPDLGKKILSEFSKASPEGYKLMMSNLRKVGKQVGYEAEEEFITQGAQDFVTNMYKNKEDKLSWGQIFNNMVTAAAAGGMMGGSIGAGQVWADTKIQIDNRNSTGHVTLVEDKENKRIVEVIGRQNNGNLVGYTADGKQVVVKKESIGENITIPTADFNAYNQARINNDANQRDIETEIYRQDALRKNTQFADVVSVENSEGKQVVRPAIGTDGQHIGFILDKDISQANPEKIVFVFNNGIPKPVKWKDIKGYDEINKQDFITQLMAESGNQFQQEKAQAETIKEVGQKIEKADLKPGDRVFYNNKSGYVSNINGDDYEVTLDDGGQNVTVQYDDLEFSTVEIENKGKVDENTGLPVVPDDKAKTITKDDLNKPNPTSTISLTDKKGKNVDVGVYDHESGAKFYGEKFTAKDDAEKFLKFLSNNIDEEFAIYKSNKKGEPFALRITRKEDLPLLQPKEISAETQTTEATTESPTTTTTDTVSKDEYVQPKGVVEPPSTTKKVEKPQESAGAELTRLNEAAANNTTNVYVAPFYDTQVTELTEAEKIINSAPVKKHIKSLYKLAEALGVKIKSITTNIGGYTHSETGKKINEISHLVELDTNDLDVATEFAALAGALSPEVQESTIAAQYLSENEIGSDRHTATKITFKVDNFEQALKLIQESGLDYSSDKENSTISTLDFQADWFDKDKFNENIITFAKKLEENGIKSEKTYAPIESRLIEAEGEYGRKTIFERIRRNLGSRTGGKMLRDALSEAEKRDGSFIKEKKLAAKKAEDEAKEAARIEAEKQAKIEADKLAEQKKADEKKAAEAKAEKEAEKPKPKTKYNGQKNQKGEGLLTQTPAETPTEAAKPVAPVVEKTKRARKPKEQSMAGDVLKNVTEKKKIESKQEAKVEEKTTETTKKPITVKDVKVVKADDGTFDVILDKQIIGSVIKINDSWTDEEGLIGKKGSTVNDIVQGIVDRYNGKITNTAEAKTPEQIISDRKKVLEDAITKSQAETAERKAAGKKNDGRVLTAMNALHDFNKDQLKYWESEVVRSNRLSDAKSESEALSVVKFLKGEQTQETETKDTRTSQEKTKDTNTVKDKLETLSGILQKASHGEKSALPIVIRETVDELPEAVKNHPNFSRDVAAVKHLGRVYFVAENIKSEEEAVKLWIHEVGVHGGMENLIPNGEDRKAFYERTWESAKALAKLYPEYADLINRIERDYKGNDALKGAEFLAYMSETVFGTNGNIEDIYAKLKPSEKTFWKKLLDDLHAIISKVFNLDAKYFTEQELTDIIKAAVHSNFFDTTENSLGKFGKKVKNNYSGERLNRERDFTQFYFVWHGSPHDITKSENGDKTVEELNLLRWDKQLTEKQADVILKQAEKEGFELRHPQSPFAKAKYVTRVNGDGTVKMYYSYISDVLGSNKEASLFLSRAGFDGIKYPAEGRGDNARGLNYVIFNENDIEIEDHTQFSKKRTSPTQKVTIPPGTPNRGENAFAGRHPAFIKENSWNSVREYIQDAMLSVRLMQEEILGRGGVVDHNSNPYIQENHAQSASKAQITKFNNDFVKPFRDFIENIIKTTDITYDQITEYMIAKHAPERNAYMEKQFGKKDGSGMKDSYAERIIKSVEQRMGGQKVADEFWQHTRRMTNFTINRWMKDGFITKSERNEYLDRYKYYVPLRGWEGDTAEDFYEYQDSDLNSSYSPNAQAKGRTTMADDPFAYIQSMAHTAIVSGNKNKTKLAAYEQLMLNKAKGVKMDDIVKLKKRYFLGNTNVEIEYEDYLKLPEADKKKIRVSTESSHKIRNTSKNSIQHEVTVFKDGKKKILVYSDPNVARSLNHHNMVNQGKFIRSYIAPINRWLATNFTAKNPAFIPINLLRDIGYAWVSHAIRKDSDVGTFAKNLIPAIQAINRNLHGKKGESIDDTYEEFQLLGGETGYVHMGEIKDFKNEIDKYNRRLSGNQSAYDRINNSKIMQKAGKFMDNLAVLSENTSRFATYLTSLEITKQSQEYKDLIAANKGEEAHKMATQKAIADAKNITVNFNRKGRASSLFGNLYAFFNASVQGSQNIISLAKHNPKTFGTAAGLMMAMGSLTAMMARMWGGDDDDGNNYYDQIPDYIKYNFLVMPNPAKFFKNEKGESYQKDKFITIPLPFGFRLIYSYGVMINELINGKKNSTQIASSVATSTADAFSPTNMNISNAANGNVGIRGIVPTPALPFYDIAVNEDFAGRRVFKEPFTKELEKFTPASELGLTNVNDLLYFSAKELNKLGGGNETRPANLPNIAVNPTNGKVEEEKWKSALDWNPSKIEHILEFYLGGRGKFFNDIYKTGKGVAQDIIDPQEETHVNTRNIPIASRIIYAPYKGEIPSAYWEIRNEVNIFDHYLLEAKNNGNIEVVSGMTKNMRMMELSKLDKIYQGIIQKVNDKIKSLPNTKENEKMIEKLNNERINIQKQFVSKSTKIIKKYDNENED